MKKNVSLVEDNFEISELIGYLLAELNLDVKTFTTITSFKSELNNPLPDLIILDIMLPDGNGIDTCREIKLDEHTRATPVLLMSAHVNIQTKVKESTADDFIGKPFDINDFMAKVNKYVAD